MPNIPRTPSASCSDASLNCMISCVVMIRMRHRDHHMEPFPHLPKATFCRRIRPQVPRSTDPHQLLYQSGMPWLLRDIIPTFPFPQLNRVCIVISSHERSSAPSRNSLFVTLAMTICFFLSSCLRVAKLQHLYNTCPLYYHHNVLDIINEKTEFTLRS